MGPKMTFVTQLDRLRRDFSAMQHRRGGRSERNELTSVFTCAQMSRFV